MFINEFCELFWQIPALIPIAKTILATGYSPDGSPASHGRQPCRFPLGNETQTKVSSYQWRFKTFTQILRSEKQFHENMIA